MDRHDCLRNARRPSIEPNQFLSTGRFVRNMEEAKKFDPKDGTPPTNGYRIRGDKWGWESDDEDWRGPSVCQECCLASPICAIAMNPSPDRYHYLLSMELAEMSRFANLDIVAIYTPVENEAAPNPCHFELMHREGHPEQVRLFFEHLDNTLKRPISTSPEVVALRAEYLRIFRFIDIRDIVTTSPEASPTEGIRSEPAPE